jgi:hypothetical protein
MCVRVPWTHASDVVEHVVNCWPTALDPFDNRYRSRRFGMVRKNNTSIQSYEHQFNMSFSNRQ